jgi:tyrosine-protein kinase Etk/Wzc
MSTHKIAYRPVFDSPAENRSRPRTIDKQVLIKVFRILLVCVAIAVASAMLYKHFSKPEYQITSSFSINSSGNNQPSALTISRAKTPEEEVQQKVNAEVDFLTSRSNLLQVVQKFNLSVRYRNMGLFQDEDLYLKSPVDFQRLRMGAQPSGHFSLTIKNGQSFIFKPAKGKSQEYTFNTTYTDDLGSWRIQRLANISSYIGKTIRIDVLDPELAVDKLQADLDVTQSGKPQNSLKLSILDPVLSRGNDIINALLISYLQNSAAEKERLAQGQLHFIDDQLVQLNQNLSNLSSQAKSPMASAPRQANSGPATQYLLHVKKNDQALNRLTLRISALRELEQQFKNQKQIGSDSLISVVSEPLLNATVRTLYENELTYKRLLQTHLPQDPEVTGTLQQIHRLRKSIVEEIGAGMAMMVKERDKLTKENEGFRKEVSGLPEGEIRQLEIDRKTQGIQALYADLLRSKENADLNHASYLAFNAPMNRSLVVQEKKPFSFAMLFIGFAIPAGFFFFKEQQKTRPQPKSNH